jgi:hypothetical protein
VDAKRTGKSRLSWFTAFLLTQLLELPVYVLGLRRRGHVVAAFIGFGATALSHPILWFVLQPLLQPRWGYWGFVLGGELAVWFIEALFLRAVGVNWMRSMIVSFVANAFSLTMGYLLDAGCIDLGFGVRM